MNGMAWIYLGCRVRQNQTRQRDEHQASNIAAGCVRFPQRAVALLTAYRKGAGFVNPLKKKNSVLRIYLGAQAGYNGPKRGLKGEIAWPGF
jgi:hypothetical protein